MASSQAFGSTEILQVADAVSREKGLPREAVVQAMAQAIEVAGRRKYGNEHNIRAEIDHKNGEVKLYRIRTVVETVENEITQLSLADAKQIDANAEIGDELKDQLPPIDFGRVAAQTAKQVIMQKVRDAEREKQFEEFKDRVGEIVSGVVKRVEYGNVTVDFGRTEAVIRRDELIPREQFRPGDRIRAYIYDVRRERVGPQIFLSRVRPEFMAKLFAQEVPEIYDAIIEIKSVARDPGSRAKIAVTSRDPSVNPVLSCIGVRGSRVQAVVSELQGEKIDIIEWSPDPATFVVNALSSAEVSKVVIDENRGTIELVVPDEQLSLAIGRRGQNVRLASQLTGWNIDILTEATESERRAEEFRTLSQMFIDALDVEEVIAHLLVTEGFTTIEEVAYIPLEDLSSIEGFDDTVAGELRNRAMAWLKTREDEQQQKLQDLGISQELATFEGLDYNVLTKLGEQGIKTGDDFAGLASDELLEMLPSGTMTKEQADALIMTARERFFA
ncbi:MAG: transcription termination/antitermination protein NusA [Alphaproteobacteria bacterium]|nr:transcription termination/antitermination protein NusA [Alphaproteobacteria bacterium]